MPQDIETFQIRVRAGAEDVAGSVMWRGATGADRAVAICARASGREIRAVKQGGAGGGPELMEANLQDCTEHAESAGRGLPHVVVEHGEGDGIDRWSKKRQKQKQWHVQGGGPVVRKESADRRGKERKGRTSEDRRRGRGVANRPGWKRTIVYGPFGGNEREMGGHGRKRQAKRRKRVGQGWELVNNMHIGVTKPGSPIGHQMPAYLCLPGPPGIPGNAPLISSPSARVLGVVHLIRVTISDLARLDVAVSYPDDSGKQ
jgi:hypothetical protein